MNVSLELTGWGGGRPQWDMTERSPVTVSQGRCPPGPAGQRMGEGRGRAEARGRPSMGHANSDFKIIVTEREEEGKEEMGLERKP